MNLAHAVWFILVFVSCESKPLEYQYGVILDAGSTSTKTYVYRWLQKQKVSVPPKIEQISKDKAKPSVSAIHSRTSELQDYLSKIISNVLSDVPSDSVNNTSIYFMATAGLRLLDEETTKQILDEVADIMSNDSVNPFKFTRDQAVILSGEDEAVFAWLAVNYLSGGFDTENETVGVIEIGGGSVQIAYVPDYPIYSGKVIVRIMDRVYNLYTHSYMSFGASSIGRRIQDHLIKENPQATALINPCMLKGDNENITTGDLKKVLMEGRGHSSQCRDIIKQYLTKAPDHLCSPKPCTIGGVYASPIPARQFIALGNIYNTANELKLLNNTDTVTPDGMAATADYFCTLSLKEVGEEYHINERFASSDCQNGVYIPELLTSLGLDSGAKEIAALERINDVKVGWSLGAVLLLIEEEFKQKCFSEEGC